MTGFLVLNSGMSFIRAFNVFAGLDDDHEESPILLKPFIDVPQLSTQLQSVPYALFQSDRDLQLQPHHYLPVPEMPIGTQPVDTALFLLRSFMRMAKQIGLSFSKCLKQALRLLFQGQGVDLNVYSWSEWNAADDEQLLSRQVSISSAIIF